MEATVFFIMNAAAAGDDDLRELIGRLRTDGYDVEARVTWEQGHAGMFAQEAAAADAAAIIGCGGDGTLNEIVNAVMHYDHRPVIGGLPYGTGNDFLRSLDILPRHSPEQLEQWLDVEPSPIDVGDAGERYFLNMATAGVAAEVTAEASRQFKDVAGSFAYFVRAIPAAFDLTTRSAHVHGDGLDWDGQLAFLFVGNGRRSGGGWTLCPAAKLDDGLLDVVVVPDMPLREMARHGRQMVKAESPGDYGPIIYRQLRRVRVQFDAEIPINLDGEPQQGQTFAFEAVERAVRFLIPPP